LVEEVAVVVEFEGDIVWLRVAVANTDVPFKPTRSGPLVKLKVPVTV
jgi:hypothetical protein